MLHQVATRRQGTLKGGYVAKKEEGDLELIILAAGSEVQHAISAAEALGKGVRVVSVPSMYRFDLQSAEYKAEVLPSSCTKRVAMEVRPCVCCWSQATPRHVFISLFQLSVGCSRVKQCVPG